MSIKLKVTDEQKNHMANFDIEARVLDNMLKERKVLMDKEAVEILTTNGLDHKLYAMRFSPGQDLWEAILKPGAIAVPVPGSNIRNIRGNGG